MISVTRLGLGLAVLLMVTPADARRAELASYQATYDLVLDSSGDTGDLVDVSGRLVIEFTGSRCAGYRSKMRFVTHGGAGDGQDKAQVADSRAESLETADGRFEFSNETYTNDELSEASSGRARHDRDGIAVVLTKPAAKTVKLGGDVAFPTEQMERIIAAGSRGENFLQMDVYDGSQSGDVVFTTATVIAPASTKADDFGDEPLVGTAGFAGLRHWPIVISYFDRDSHSDDTPTYTTSFVLYANGVGRKLRIDYGKYALIGKLTHLEMLPPSPPC